MLKVEEVAEDEKYCELPAKLALTCSPLRIEFIAVPRDEYDPSEAVVAGDRLPIPLPENEIGTLAIPEFASVSLRIPDAVIWPPNGTLGMLPIVMDVWWAVTLTETGELVATTVFPLFTVPDICSVLPDVAAGYTWVTGPHFPVKADTGILDVALPSPQFTVIVPPVGMLVA